MAEGEGLAIGSLTKPPYIFHDKRDDPVPRVGWGGAGGGAKKEEMGGWCGTRGGLEIEIQNFCDAHAAFDNNLRPVN